MKSNDHNTIVSVADLAIGYKALNIGQNINFSLGKGTLCAIVGINGIGKSTLLRTVGKLQPLQAGSVSLNGKALYDYTNQELSTVLSVVLTEHLPTKNLTVLELISLGRQPHTNWMGTLTKNDQKKIDESIQRMGIQNFTSKKCYQLSDGQLQKVMVARAVAQDTPIILLDEPTTHLDLYHKISIIKLLRQLAHQNQKTIIFTTHEIELALQLCDNILILDGKSNPFGTSKSLIEAKHFEELFPKEMVQFDQKTSTFKVNK
ncbi:MAG: ABC transporter ATP-binding protein [Bacteroidota bacterium]